MNHQQGPPAMLPCLDSISHVLNPDRDTNFLSNLISNQVTRAALAIDLAKSLYDRLEKDHLLFKSPKEVEWATEILGYAFIPPHYQYVKEDKNYLKYILNIYEFMVCHELEVVNEGKAYSKQTINKPVLDYENYSHQKVLLKMLSHLTLLFDKRNFEKKPNPLVGDPRIREEEMKVPIKLCAIVIRIYNRFLFKAYPYLYIDHWEYIIKLLLGLASHILQASTDTKFPDRIVVAITELVYNSWLLSGLQNEEMWTTFKNYIYSLINKDVVISYWSDICHELTTKLLTDLKCYDAPQLIIQDKQDRVEYNESFLIISHNYNVRSNGECWRIIIKLEFLGNDIQSRNKFTLFLQPFIFNISQEQIQYLWGKMITMMNKINNGTIASPVNNSPAQLTPRISLLITKGIRNVITLLLQLGGHSKPRDEVLHYLEGQNFNEYSIENKRKIVIEHDYTYFRNLLKQITKNGKIGRNERKPPQSVPQHAKSDEEKAFRNFGNYNEAASPKLVRRAIDEHANNVLGGEKEYGWVVKTEKIPSGESLLKLFGKLLFDNATDLRPEFEEVRLMAISTLCQIFTKASGPFLEPTVKKFYQVYLDYLGSISSWTHFQSLLKSSTELFLVNHLSHNIILQKPLVQKLVEFYKKPKGDDVFKEKKVLRRSCNKLCSSLLCFFNDESGLINEVYRYERNVKDIFYELLELAFEKDKEAFLHHIKSQKEEAKILARSAWNFMIYSILDYKIALFVKKFDKKTEWLDKSSPILNNLVIDMLLVLGEMCLTRLDECETSNQMSNDILESGRMIIDNICEFIEARIREPEHSKQISSKNIDKDELARQKEETTRLISSCLGILHTWLLIIVHLKDINSFEQRSNNEQIYSEIFEQALKLLQSCQNIEPFSKHIKGMISSLFNRLGSMSFSKNVPFTSSVLLNDDQSQHKQSLDELIQKFEEKCLLSIGVGDDTILSFYDLQIESTNEVLLLVIRNTVGKFAWFGELYYKLFCPTKKDPEDGLKDLDLVKRASSAKEEELKPRLMSHDMLLSPRSGGANQELELLLQQQFEVEDQYEETYNKNKEKQSQERSLAETPTTATYVSSFDSEEEKSLAKINAIKMFLSNTGILTLKDLHDLTHIPPEVGSKVAFRQIDATPTRCQILTSIFYVLKPSSERIDEFPRFDNLFQKFIEELGIIVDDSTLELGAHESIRRHVEQYKKVLYASNPLYEVVFSLPNLTAQANFPEKFTVPPITIIWNAKVFTPYESFYPYIINHFDIKGYKTAIVITPLNEGYFNLNVLKKDSDFMMFPPVNDFICSAHMLANVVLQTVISIHKEFQFRQQYLYYHEAVLGKIFDRKEHISTLIKSYKTKEDSSWELLKAFFNAPKPTNK